MPVRIGDQVLPGLFRRLTTEEQAQFRAHTRETYTPPSEIDGTWHPLVQDECRIINKQFYID
jgi:hypothetical protein